MSTKSGYRDSIPCQRCSACVIETRYYVRGVRHRFSRLDTMSEVFGIGNRDSIPCQRCLAWVIKTRSHVRGVRHGLSRLDAMSEVFGMGYRNSMLCQRCSAWVIEIQYHIRGVRHVVTCPLLWPLVLAPTHLFCNIIYNKPMKS